MHCAQVIEVDEREEGTGSAEKEQAGNGTLGDEARLEEEATAAAGQSGARAVCLRHPDAKTLCGCPDWGLVEHCP
eukprot:1277451-Prymnesium_polylepis.1